LAACGGDSDGTNTSITLPLTGTPEQHVEAASEIVREGFQMSASVGDGAPAAEVNCAPVPHTRGRPRGRQYDYRCVVIDEDDKTWLCTVPAGSRGQHGCSDDGRFPER
jgi:hypothetical protein